MRKPMILISLILISVLQLTGCASSKQKVFGRDMPTMKAIHDDEMLPRYVVGTDAAMFMEAKKMKTDLEFEKYLSKELFPSWYRTCTLNWYTDKIEFSSKSTSLWWNDMKWKTLQHNGILFPPAYEAQGIKVKIKGEAVNLDLNQEEMVGFPNHYLNEQRKYRLLV